MFSALADLMLYHELAELRGTLSTSARTNLYDGLALYLEGMGK